MERTVLSVRPSPICDLRHIDAVLMRVVAAIDLDVAEPLLGVSPDFLELRGAVDRVDRQGEAVDLIVDGEFHGRVDIAFFLVPAHVQIPVIGAAVGQAMNQPGITVEIEDDGFVDCKETVEITIIQTMWMFPVGLHLEQVDDIDEPSF